MNKKNARLKALIRQTRRISKALNFREKQSRKFSTIRLLIFLAAVFIGIPIFWLNHTISYVVITGFIFIFNIVAYFHRRMDASIERHRIYLDIKQHHIARIQLDWDSLPTNNSLKLNENHPFELDLDITGSRSLHHLIDLSVSHGGSEYLKKWLLDTDPDLTDILNRQKIIQILSPKTRFRDKMLLNFKQISKQRLDDKKLLNWLESVKSPKSLILILKISSVFALFNWVLFVLNLFNILPPYFIISLAIYGIIYLMNSQMRSSIFEEAEFLIDEIKKYRSIFQYVEKNASTGCEQLQHLCSAFLDSINKPSMQLKRLKRISTAIGLRMNYVTGLLLNLALPWDFWCAFLLHKSKLELKDKLPLWLDVCFQMEAYISLANFAYLNPEYQFPIIKTEESKPVFIAKEIGHPLIPFQEKKCNDFQLGQLGEIVLVTGSNMSGKSTFLRTLGINLCLAYAGAPVNAEKMDVGKFRIFTCIRINDSLSEGVSQFYAEVKRLKTLSDQLKKKNDLALFYLIDEIYKGTNNRERLLGSRALIRSFIGEKGVGVISTHDLELTQLADQFSDAKNYHFREEIRNGNMVFDYQLRTGPCPTTNALKIMALEGLPVDFSKNDH